jgi:uncharacterized membrane protein YjjB (DUF3815 family)
MFKASVLLAIVAALLLALISHSTGSVVMFKGALAACAYLALCALARLGGSIERT